MSQLGDITQGAPQSSSGGEVESLGSHGGVPGIASSNGLCELACTPVLLSGHIPSLCIPGGKGRKNLLTQSVLQRLKCHMLGSHMPQIVFIEWNKRIRDWDHP